MQLLRSWWNRQPVQTWIRNQVTTEKFREITAKSKNNSIFVVKTQPLDSEGIIYLLRVAEKVLLDCERDIICLKTKQVRKAQLVTLKSNKMRY